MFNKKEKEFNDLMDQVDRYEKSDEINVRAAAGDFAAKLAQIGVGAAISIDQWVAAIKAAAEVLWKTLYGDGSDKVKWVKIARAFIQIAGFAIAIIRSLKSVKF